MLVRMLMDTSLTNIVHLYKLIIVCQKYLHSKYFSFLLIIQIMLMRTSLCT